MTTRGRIRSSLPMSARRERLLIGSFFAAGFLLQLVVIAIAR